MVAESIGADVEAVLEELKRLLREQQELPSPDQVREVRGASHGVANHFARKLQSTMSTASLSVSRLVTMLEEFQEATHGALEDLAAHDDEARAALKAYDTAVEETKVTGSSSSGPASSPSAKDGYLT